MTVIELFQLIMIPVHMLVERAFDCADVCAVQLLDLFAYGVGIGCIYLADYLFKRESFVPWEESSAAVFRRDLHVEARQRAMDAILHSREHQSRCRVFSG
jgi:hypothetical protein